MQTYEVFRHAHSVREPEPSSLRESKVGKITGLRQVASMATLRLKLDELRRFAVARSLFPPTSLDRAIRRMGFVQADPIRAPARAQDLILRHRVRNYRAGDLERHCESLGIEEDFFITYGFVTREVQALLHPRPDLRIPAAGNKPLDTSQQRRERLLLKFVADRGQVHPREAEQHFAHGTVQNYWGGSSHATTQMLDALHYRGLLRVARREKGIRVYETRRGRESTDPEKKREQLDALVDLAVHLYAPLPATSLSFYVRKLRYAVPQSQPEISVALRRARERLAHATVSKVDWFWPNDESPSTARVRGKVRLLAPFDPVVHDRARVELLWGWVYRFEAYTPPAKRKLGYYALPLLWRDLVVGWCNLAVENGALISTTGYAAGHPPREQTFQPAFAAELDRMRGFLRLRV